MKKITLLMLMLMTNLWVNAQSTCRQTFTASGDDDEPTVLTINAADINCNGAGPVTSMKLIGADGSLDSFYCGDWYSFDLSIDGGTPITGCGTDFNDIDITGFTTLTITSSDLDEYSDGIDIIIDVEVTFTALTPPSCVALSTPANGDVNILNSQISWPVATGGATGYKLNVGTSSGGTNVLNMVDVGNVTTYNLGTLTAGGTYFVTVIPYNAIGDATNCTESSFTTCGINPVPAMEDFTVYVPGCWQEADNGNLTSGPSTFGNSTWVADGFGNNGNTGAIRYNIFTSGANDWFISPFYNIPGSGYELKFEAAAVQYATTNAPTTAWEADDAVEVLISNGINNWTVLYTYNDSNTPSNTGSVNIIDLDGYAGQNVRFAFRAIEGGTNGNADIDFSVDNFQIRLTPACPDITNLLVSALQSSSATISWNPPTGNFEYVLDNSATNPVGTGTSINVNSFNAGSLNPETQYYFHVRNDCGSGVYSAWTTVSFMTPPVPPANNSCSGAISLTPGGVFDDQSISGTVYGATTTPGIIPSCQNDFGSDTWYTVVVPASGSITIETKVSTSDTMTDSVIAVFSGTCGSLSEIDCNEDKDTDNSDYMSLLTLTGRTPGETLYVAVWKYEVAPALADEAQFMISAYDASLSSDSFDLNGFKAYPNPVKDVFTVSYVKEISSISVYNLLGQEIMNEKVNALSSNVNLSSLSRGTYFVKVTVDGLTNTMKVIKE